MRRILLAASLLLCCLGGLRAVENYPYRSDYLWVTVPDHADWTYRTGEEAAVEVTFLRYGIPQDGTVEYTVGDDLLPADASGQAELRGGRAVIRIGTRATPGFRDLRLRITLPDARPGSTAAKTYTHHVKLAFSPERIEPFTSEPEDFTAFWDAAKAEAARFPLHYTRERYEPYCTETFDTYLVRLDLDRRRHAFYGFLMVPHEAARDGRRLPVVLTCPGAGVKTIKNVMESRYYADEGCIRLVIDIHGLNPTLSERDFADLTAAFNNRASGYLENRLDSRDHYYMRHVYLGLLRCIDLLTSLPEWDGRNVIAQGGSQGGALALVAAGLDPRVTACVANHPALADMGAASDPRRTSGYPHFRPEDGTTTPDKVRTMAYYDVVNFARHITAPVYLTWGFNDDTCPPTTSYAVWNALRCPKDSLITPINEHWTSADTERGQLDWIKAHLR